MRNRINEHILSRSSSTATKLCRRPTLTLNGDQPIKVDMERFFDFSFSFAEALLDLEDKYLPETAVVSMERELSLKEAASQRQQHHEHDLDIDARWM